MSNASNVGFKADADEHAFKICDMTTNPTKDYQKPLGMVHSPGRERLEKPDIDQMNTALNVISTLEMHFSINVLIVIRTLSLVVVTRLSGRTSICQPVDQVSFAVIVDLCIEI